MNGRKKIKLIVLILLIVSLIFGITCTVKASTAEISLISNSKLSAGKNVNIFISLKQFSDDNILGLSTRKKEIIIGNINYDKNVFENVTVENFSPNEGWKVSMTKDGNYLLESSSGNFGTGVVATLSLKVKESFNVKSSNVTFENISVINYCNDEEGDLKKRFNSFCR